MYGTSGGDAGFSGGTIPRGRGGSVLIRTVADPTNSSTIQIDTLTVGVDGATATAFEMLPGMGSGGGVGNGEGGSATLDIQGGSLTAGRIDLVANGTGGGVGPGSGTGTGGTETFTQGGGTAEDGLLTVTSTCEGGSSEERRVG